MAEALVADCANRNDLQLLVAHLQDHHIAIDVLVNNAGTICRESALDYANNSMLGIVVET